MVFTDKINIVMHDTSQGIYKKNILSKSLNAEVFKTTTGILLIFFLLVVGSRFVGYFEQASEGLIDPNIIFRVVLLRFPDFITLLLPFSFFLGIILTISRLYAESEIYGYFSVGLSKIDMIKFLLPQSLVFFFITLALSLYIAPYTKDLSKELISIDTFEEKFKSIKPKKLTTFARSDGFIYIEAKKDNTFLDVTSLMSNEKSSMLIVAENMNFQDEGSTLDLEFNNGSLHEGVFSDENKIISNFNKLKIPVDKDTEIQKNSSLTKLFDYSLSSSKSEILWNVSIPLTIFVLLILGVSLSKVEPRQGRYSVMLPALAFYVFYLSLLILSRDFSESNTASSHYYFGLIHATFLLIGLVSLLRSSTSFFNNILSFNQINLSSKIILATISIIIFLWMVS